MMKGLFGKKKEKPEKEKAEKPETEKAEKPERRGLFGKKKGAKGSKGAPAPAAPAAGAAGAAVDDAADEEALALAARLAALKPRARRSEFDVAYLREVMGRFERTKNLFSLVTNASISLGEAQALFQVDDSDDLRRLFERFAKPRGLGLGAIARPPPPLGELARVGRKKAGAADSRSSRESSRQPPALPPPPHEFELRADLFEVLSGLALVCDGELEARARLLFDLFNLDGSGELEEDELICLVTSVARAATCLDLAPPTDEAELEWICGQAFVDAELADLEPRTMTRKLKAAAKRAAAPERLRRQSFAELDPLHGVADRAEGAPSARRAEPRLDRAFDSDDSEPEDENDGATRAQPRDGGLSFDEFLRWTQTHSAPLCLFEWLKLGPRVCALIKRFGAIAKHDKERLANAPAAWARAEPFGAYEMGLFASPLGTRVNGSNLVIEAPRGGGGVPHARAGANPLRLAAAASSRLWLHAPSVIVLGPRSAALVLEAAMPLRLLMHTQRLDRTAPTNGTRPPSKLLVQPAAMRTLAVGPLEPGGRYLVVLSHVDGCRDARAVRVWSTVCATPEAPLAVPRPLAPDDAVAPPSAAVFNTKPQPASVRPFRLGFLARGVAHERDAWRDEVEHGEQHGFDALVHLALPLSCTPAAGERSVEVLAHACSRDRAVALGGGAAGPQTRARVEAARRDASMQLRRACLNGLHQSPLSGASGASSRCADSGRPRVEVTSATIGCVQLICPISPWIGIEVRGCAAPSSVSLLLDAVTIITRPNPHNSGARAASTRLR